MQLADPAAKVMVSDETDELRIDKDTEQVFVLSPVLYGPGRSLCVSGPIICRRDIWRDPARPPDLVPAERYQRRNVDPERADLVGPAEVGQIDDERRRVDAGAGLAQ